MPGLVGIITRKPREVASAELRRMVAAMHHEPFYQSGTWIDADLGVFAGWVDLEDASPQPAPQVNETGDRILIFSGSDFPEPGTSQRLRERGHQVVEGNLAHLVHVAEEDAEFPEGLNGQFHGLLIDRRRQTALLFNDRYAARRLYIHQASDGFYFAAEAKALLAVKPELRRVNEQGLAEWVSCGCPLEDRTLFREIAVLPWAAAWVFRYGQLESRGQYFSLDDWVEQDPLDPEAYYQAMRQAFAANLPRYFPDGDRIGMSLTGGLDTRIIMAMHRASPGSLPCYTFGSGFQECRDVRIARKIARICGQPYHVIPVAGEFLKTFAEHAEKTVYITDGCADVKLSPGLYANRCAREFAPVRMTGNFGDEMVRRWVVFHPSPSPDAVFDNGFAAQVADAAKTYARSMGSLKPAHAAIRQISWFFHAMMSMERSQIQVRSPFLDNQLIRTACRGDGTVLPANDVRVRMIRDSDARLSRIRTDLGYGGRGGKLATTYWYLFHRATMRAEYAFENGDPPWLARFDRRFLGGSLERRFVGLHKFTHFARWYRESLADYLRQMLLDPRTLKRPYLNPRAVEAAVEGHLKGESNHTPAINKLLTLEYFHRLFVDAK